MFSLEPAATAGYNGHVFPGKKKIISFQFPACFSQGAHDMQSPNTVNKLAAISRVNVTLGHKMSWEPGVGGRDSLMREVNV